ncbi:hypothetical protein O6H91_08G004100 [Diphasiastrum complanatum]|uniref:Uncharacterized protein n=5 Tax=Diphasiastrum complanatum TaxID=34168 RepID=A0ACC2CUP5_DIPCM|nr:hypothetical protein O6H91_08G004100 [Diphasiastrum complanatum]KAJ7545622.1 hypothetical protein O6H91_08G004100 [Diphasiastrum complanatum]KAJ7545633.1 hypothetical protein O6H91_08G004100 [Diphasiastrum complanatum]KAJ7545634.1 hypothetical protein O6H91_08G004100 [Diphasiastrum complanatum]KAJ7545639.1 hypothetical protein O6H91_08G004100 [Diphasiastrum complanatum]
MTTSVHGIREDFDLPQAILSALPSDPFEQLDVARKITSMALISRVEKMEVEEIKLLRKLSERDGIVSSLQERLANVEQSLEETSSRLSHALDEQVKLTNEKAVLLTTVKKLTQEVAKLETFKRTLLQSLQAEEENSPQVDGGEKVTSLGSVSTRNKEYFTKACLAEDYASLSKTRSASDLLMSDGVHSEQHPLEEASKHGIRNESPHSLTSLPTSKLSPPGSPLKRSTTVSPMQLHLPDAANRMSLNERSPIHFSLPASQPTTAPNSPPGGGTLPARTSKVDGKEFFRQARGRLSYEQFSVFLESIKELNAHKQTREDTLKKAEQIFGPQNADLYADFETLLSRHH